jgi:RNA polymerase sigma factor (sigma-70 family)
MTEKEIEEKLIEYRGLIVSTSKRYFIDGMTWEDNFQELSLVFIRTLKEYEKTKGTDFKTLFIRYSKQWAWYHLRKQNFAKRGKMIVYSEYNKDGLDELWIDSIIDMGLDPSEIEKKERLAEDIQKFINEDKNGYLITMITVDDKTLQEIAKEEGVSFQAISQRHIATKNKLKEWLKLKGYELD